MGLHATTRRDLIEAPVTQTSLGSRSPSPRFPSSVPAAATTPTGYRFFHMLGSRSIERTMNGGTLVSATRHHTMPLLGELELAVMDFLWQHGPGDVRALHEAIGSQRNITSNTVQSTLKRLHDKGLADREKVSHAYIYASACTRAEFHARALGQVVGDLKVGEADAVLAAFVDIAERAGSEQLERLEALVAARLSHGGGDP
jgi:predicted transcriptional regulator